MITTIMQAVRADMADVAALGEQLLDAACDNDSERVRVLLAAGEVGVNYKDCGRWTALLCAAQAGHIEVVRALLAVAGIDANHASRGLNAALCIASEDGYVNRASTQGSTALMVAAQQGHAEIVRALLAVHGVDTNYARSDDGATALLVAAQHGRAEIVRALLAVHGIDANQTTTNGFTALITASENDHAEVVRVLLALNGINANQANDNGNTALLCASQRGHAEVVRALLAVGGIDANHANTRGSTALLLASQNGHAEIVRALLAVDGIDSNYADNSGRTALAMCVVNTHAGCVRALAAAAGIDINLPCSMYGNLSALHLACEKQSAEMVEVLLLAGGCSFRRTDDGRAPPDLAAGHKGVLKVFASGIDYWQRKRHGDHSWAMKEAVTTLLLVRQRLDAQLASALPPAPPQGCRALRPESHPLACTTAPLLHLPEEIWLAACGFLRSADYMP